MAHRCAVYNLTAGKTFPVWTTPEQRKKLMRDEAYRSRVMVLQDFEMPEASQKMRITRDQKHLFVSGTYKPRVKSEALPRCCVRCSHRFLPGVNCFSVFSIF
jgi:hypothetical protein